MHHPGISVNLRKGSGQDIPFFTIPIRLYRVTNDGDKKQGCVEKTSKKRIRATGINLFRFCWYNFIPVGLLAQLVELRTLNP